MRIKKNKQYIYLRKQCSKCGRELPAGYRHRLCERCFNKKIEGIGGKALEAGALAASALGGAVIVAKKKIFKRPK